MIRLFVLIAGIGLFSGPAPGASPTGTDLGGFVHQMTFQSADTTAAIQVRQWVSPVQLHLPFIKGRLDLYSGVMHIEQTGAVKAEAFGALNTRIRATWPLGGRALLTLQAAFPSGKRSLDAEDAALVRTLARSDLNFPVKTFGEGLEIGGALSLAKQVGHWGWSVGAGYLRKNAYAPLEGVDGYKPGDEITFSGGLDYTRKHWVYRLSAGGTLFLTDRQKGKVLFQNGKQLLVRLALLYDGRLLRLTARLTELMRLKNQGLVPPDNQFLFETRNSNGNDLRVFFEARWTPYTALALFGSATFKQLTANAHPQSSPLYQGDARLLEAGGGLELGLGPKYRLIFNGTRMTGKVLDKTIDLSAFHLRGVLSRQF